MSYYDDEQPRRHRSHRHSRPVYEEEVIETRQSKPSRREPEHMELVRRRDSDDSVEEVRRDFPPGGGDGMYVQRRTTTRDRYAPRTRSMDRHSRYDDEYDDPRRSDPAVARHTRRRVGKPNKADLDTDSNFSLERRRYDSESEEDSPPRRKVERRKSMSEQALGAVGLGGAAAALAKLRGRHDDRSPSRSPSRDGRRARSRSRRGRHEESYSRSRSRTPPRDKSRDHKKKITQAAKAAATAGVIEAWRARKEPGGFAGQGKRILTAAIGAAGIDGAISGKDPEHHSTRHTIEAALGGLAGNRLLNGPREQSRSRSKVRGEEHKSGTDIGGIASAAGIAALAGKAFNDYRSKSRGREENRDDSRSPERRSRSRSVSEYISRGVDGAMAKLGLGNPKEHDPKYAEGSDRRRRRYSSDDDDYYRSRPRGGGAEEQQIQKHKNHSDSDDTDSYSSENEVKKQRKIRNKAMLTGGLATVATIHAIANVHGSMEKGKERHKKVAEGKMSVEEARKKKSKALLQDAASVGIAAIGIKSAASEWKELKEKREEYNNSIKRLEEKREHRRQKLLRSKSASQSDGDLHSRYEEDVYYYRDDNPYNTGVMSPPPMGGHRSGYR